MLQSTTSMGRLTLNVLLSFAQFEGEVTSERDKIAAPKRRGLWVGGPLAGVEELLILPFYNIRGWLRRGRRASSAR